MATLTGKKGRMYMSKAGNPVFPYTLTGSKEAIDAYSESKGEQLRTDDDGNPIFFSTTPYGNDIVLHQSEKSGNFFVDTEKQQALGALIKQFGADAGRTLWQEMYNVQAQPAVASVASAPVASASEDELNEDID